MIPWLKKNKAVYSSKKLSVKTKGLSNNPGQNNCFLNSAVQVLWHLDVFRTNFSRFTGHNCDGESCIFCALKNLFARFKYSNQEILPPTELRVSLANVYQEQNRFQLGLMDDAAECFENLLLRIHCNVVEDTREEDCMCTAKHCISHQKFGMMLIEQGVCECGETSEPLPFVQLVHYVSASALCVKLKVWRRYAKNHHASDHDNRFGRLIKSAASLGGKRNCPSNCGSQIETKTSLMNCPDVISVGLNWDSAQPSIDHIVEVLHTLSTTLRLQDMFDIVLDKTAQKNEYHLVALVCYYGKHYSTFFFNRKSNRWLSIDDASVSVVGKHWRDVLIKCIKGHYQPLLLLYTNFAAEPVSFTNAPLRIKMAPSSAKSSPSLSRKDDLSVASSSSSGSPSPSRKDVVTNGNATRPKKYQFNWAVSQNSKMGHYVEPNTAKWTTYKPYETPGTNPSRSLKFPSSTSDATESKGFPTL